MKIGLCVLFLIASITFSAFAETEISSSIDWQSGNVVVAMRFDIKDLSANPAEARAKARDIAAREIEAAFSDVMYATLYDSYRTVKDVAVADPGVMAALQEIGSAGTPAGTHMDTELETIVYRYEFRLYPDIMSRFVAHSRTYEPVQTLGFVPASQYTGLVIYAKGAYPVHGESPVSSNHAALEPSLRPKIYDTNMRLVAQAEMVDPERLVDWGVVGFTEDIDHSLYSYRVGVLPLRTMARKLFGDNRTDIVIPVDVADKLLAAPENRRIIREGRILVIIGQ